MNDWKDTDIIEVKEPRLGATQLIYLPEILAGLKITLKHLLNWRNGRDRFVVQYPEERREAPETWKHGQKAGLPLNTKTYRGWHRLNRDERGNVACVACFMCSTACPANCIRIVGGPAPWEYREKYPVEFEIDELRCIYCGMCEEACPVNAIELTYEYDVVGTSRKQMVYDKEALLAVYDRTKGRKPRPNPAITGFDHTGHPQA
jgi:NADH-quinone oxidoreductase subunit I